MTMHIRDVPDFFRKYDKHDIANCIDSMLKNRDDTKNDDMDTDILNAYLEQNILYPPTPFDIICSNDFVILHSIAFIIRELRYGQ